MKEEKNKESEFGKGLAYCLGLFLAHTERYLGQEESSKKPLDEWHWHMWFNSASDHLYEIVIPISSPSDIKKRLKELQEKCLQWGHGSYNGECSRDSWVWAVKEAKELLRLIDEWNGIETIEASWK